MALTTITKSTIISTSFNNIFETLDTRSYIADPRDPAGVKSRKYVYSYDPLETSVDFALMPYLFAEFPTVVEGDKDRLTSMDGKHKSKAWKIEVVVRTVLEGAGNSSTDAGRTDMQNICDDLEETFNSETIKQTLRAVGIRNIAVEKTQTGTSIIDRKVVFESAYIISFSQRMAVSS